MDSDFQPEDDLVTTTTPAARRIVRRAKKAKPKKKSAGAAAPAVKVDAAQALAFVRSRIRDEKDPIIKALYERELTGLAERAKKAEEERRANRFITVAKSEKVKLGTHLFEVQGAESGYYHGRRTDAPKPKLVEYILKDVQEKSDYGRAEKNAVCSIVGGGQKTIDGYHFKSLYTDPRSAVDFALKGVEDDVKQARAQFEEETTRRDALLDLRKAVASGTVTPATSGGNDAADGRSRKRWTESENAILKAQVEAGKTPEQIAQDLGRARDRVVRQMHKLGIKAESTPFHDYKAERDDAGEPKPEAPAERPGHRSMFDVEDEIAQAGV